MNKSFTIAEILTKLRPNSSWSMTGNNYEDILWMDPNNECPSEDEVLDELENLQAEYDALLYQRQRAAEYPSIVDQLDLLYHQGYDGWKETIANIKDKYPKP